MRSSNTIPASETSTSVTDFGPASPMSRPCGMPGHYDEWCFRMDLALVDVTQSPVVKPVPHEIGNGAGRIIIMTGDAAQARMQYSDIDQSGDGRTVLGKQALGCMPPRETHTMDRDPPSREAAPRRHDR